MTKKDFLQKGYFKKLHLQLTISYFPENVTFFKFPELKCLETSIFRFFLSFQN